MKTKYEKPMINIVEVELTQLMVGSTVLEDGFDLDGAGPLGDDIVDGNLSRGW